MISFFLKEMFDNRAKAMEVWNVFALVLSLHINMWKSMLIRCTESILVDLRKRGQILNQGNVCQHLGLPYWCWYLTVSKFELDNIGTEFLDKFMYWKLRAWSFSTNLKVA